MPRPRARPGRGPESNRLQPQLQGLRRRGGDFDLAIDGSAGGGGGLDSVGAAGGALGGPWEVPGGTLWGLWGSLGVAWDPWRSLGPWGPGSRPWVPVPARPWVPTKKMYI